MINKDKYRADIIIISYKNPGLTIQCVESIRETMPFPVRIIIVDNASPDDTVSILQSNLSDVEIIVNDANRGYSFAVNRGFEISHSDYVIISNNDVIYHKGVIEGLLMTLDSNSSIGAVGPGQIYGDGSWQLSHGHLPGLSLGIRKFMMFETMSNIFSRMLWKRFRSMGIIKSTGYIDGACMAVRREAFDRAGGFDEDYFFYTEEADFCYRLTQFNYKIISNPNLVITHLRGGSSNQGNLESNKIEMLVKSKILFCSKHLSDSETLLYVNLEKLHNYSYLIGLKLFGFLLPSKSKEKVVRRIRIMDDFYRCWKTELEKLKY